MRPDARALPGHVLPGTSTLNMRAAPTGSPRIRRRLNGQGNLCSASKGHEVKIRTLIGRLVTTDVWWLVSSAGFFNSQLLDCAHVAKSHWRLGIRFRSMAKVSVD
jgi:hypothetical protein